MPKIEVDEAEWNQRQALFNVAQKIAAKPESRKLLEQAHKLVDEKALTPTLDAEERQMGPVKDLEKKLQEKLDAIEARDAEREKSARISDIARSQAEGLARLRRAGYTDEGVAAVQKLMDDKGLLDVDDAVAIFERNNPPPTPVTPGGIGSWGFADLTTSTDSQADKSIAALITSKGEDNAVVDRMAIDALKEFRGQHR
jgi:hypothetical protein